MIKKVKRVCKGCGNKKFIFSKGMCESCQPRNKIKSQGVSIKTTSKSIKSNRPKEYVDKYKDYFEYHIPKCNRSEESNNLIVEPTKANICHLIDKGRHPSVGNNFDNYIYLTFQEHADFDRLLLSGRFEELEVEFKNSWGKACKRINKVLPLVQENTIFIRKITKYINERFKSN